VPQDTALTANLWGSGLEANSQASRIAYRARCPFLMLGDLNAKRLELLKEAPPPAKRCAA